MHSLSLQNDKDNEILKSENRVDSLFEKGGLLSNKNSNGNNQGQEKIK